MSSGIKLFFPDLPEGSIVLHQNCFTVTVPLELKKLQVQVRIKGSNWFDLYCTLYATSNQKPRNHVDRPAGETNLVMTFQKTNSIFLPLGPDAKQEEAEIILHELREKPLQPGEPKPGYFQVNKPPRIFRIVIVR
jgi:hypothetical protein